MPPQDIGWYRKNADTSNWNDMSYADMQPGYSITSFNFILFVDSLVNFLERWDLYEKVENAGNQSNQLQLLRIPELTEW